MFTRLIVLLSALVFVWPAQAVTMTVANGLPQIILRIGGAGLGISLVTFTLTAANTGNGTPVVAAPAILVRATARELIAGNRTATLTANSSLPLTSGANNISFTTISWTAAGDVNIPAGTFSGAAGQVLTSFLTSNEVSANHTFIYNNAQVVPAGTYTGRVTYTLTMP